MSPDTPANSLWRNRSGTLYRVACVAISEHGDPSVVAYRRDDGGTIWYRPLAQWPDGLERVEDGADER